MVRQAAYKVFSTVADFNYLYLILLPIFVTAFEVRKVWWAGQTAGMGSCETVTEIF
jgi:hypothetical protein